MGRGISVAPAEAETAKDAAAPDGLGRDSEDAASMDLYNWDLRDRLLLFLRHGGWPEVRVIAMPLGIAMKGKRRCVVKRIDVQLLALRAERLEQIAGMVIAYLQTALARLEQVASV
jgi:hypothetical protein